MVYPWTVLAYSFLGLGIAAWAAAIIKDHRWYWLAALCLYVFSCLGGFSIGLITLVFPFVFILIALGHALGRISNIRHSAIAGVIGAGLWLISFQTIDDYWLFFPVFKLFDLFGLH
ncbi:MAG: hypothetical protein AB1500_01085 [Bacillota bacterium]